MSLGSFIAGVLFSNIGGSATFRLFSIGALVCLVLHVVVQKVYERFAGSFGKAGEVVAGHDMPNQIVYLHNGDGNTVGQVEQNANDHKSASAESSRVLLPSFEQEEAAALTDVPLK